MHGVPDWGVTNAPRNIYQVLDLGELAARLGSIDAFDRRGDVVFLDDFEDGLGRWELDSSGAGASVRLTRALCRSGAYAAKLTAGSNLLMCASITHARSLAYWSPSGSEFSFQFVTGLLSITFGISIASATTGYVYGLMYEPGLSRILYIGSDGFWHLVIGGLPPLADPVIFHTLKLVINPEANRYARLLLDRNTYDMSAFVPFWVGPMAQPVLETDITVWGPGGTNPSALIDDVILTQNEPL